MNYYRTTFAMLGLATMLSTAAIAADLTVSTLPDKGAVTLNGTVDKVKNEREFVFRDASGDVAVEITSNQSVVLKPGQEITVFGEVDKGITGTEIKASKVSVHKDVAESVGEAVTNIANNVTGKGAIPTTVKALPDQGLVQLTGTVSDVDNEKKFTLKDSTGTVEVDIESAESAALSEGAQVNVTGYVDKGLLGKNINATNIQVVADATPMATKSH